MEPAGIIAVVVCVVILAAMLGLFVYLDSRKKSSVVKCKQEGDSAFASGAFDAAKQSYTTAVEKAQGLLVPQQETTDLHLRLALVEAALKSDARRIRSQLTHAAAASARLSYADVKRVGTELGLRAEDIEVSPALFEEARLAHLSEDVEKVVSEAKWLRATPVHVHLFPASGKIEVVGRYPRTHSGIRVETRIQGTPGTVARGLEIYAHVANHETWLAAYLGDQQGAIEEALMPANVRAIIAQAHDERTDMVRGYVDDAAYLVRLIFRAIKEHAVEHLVDHVDFHLLVESMAFWVARSTEQAFSTWDLKVRSLPAKVSLSTHTEMSALLGFADSPVMDHQLKGYWGIQEGEIPVEI